MTFTLRDYQRDSVEATYRYWADGKGENPLIVAPTGAGKTAIIAQLIKDAVDGGARVLVLSHVAELLKQGREGLLKLCPELMGEIGFYSASLKQKRLDKRITFGGIQSIWKRAYDIVPAPDLILVDEAHLVPPISETRYGSFFDDILICNSEVKIVGLTATPYRLGSGRLDTGEGALFDGIAHDIEIQMLIDRGFLSPVIAKGGKRKIDLSEVKKRGGEFIEADLAKAATADGLVEETVAEICDVGADRKSWLIFSSGVDHAMQLKAEVAYHGHAVGIITGDTPQERRAQIIADFKAQRLRALVNVNVLTTGFDAPGVDLVAMVRATASPGLYVQIVGRGTRIAPGKENCLLLDYGSNVVRHGFIDQIKAPKDKREGDDGVAPAKECPQCDGLNYAGVRVCVYCGYEWPAPKPEHETRAYSGAVLSSQVKSEWVEVDAVTVRRWTKPGKPDSLRLTYDCGLTSISEWLCPDHGGYAASRYHARMKSLGASAMTTDGALAESATWTQPGRIKVEPEGKFHKIVQLDYSFSPPAPDNAPAWEGDDEPVDFGSVAWDDEIPFMMEWR